MENSLYTLEVSHLITTAPWPEAFKYVVTETDEGLWMIIYTANYAALSHDDKLTVYRLINETFPKINKLGIPIGLKTKEGFRPTRGV